MKVHKIVDDKTIILEVGDGAFVSVHSHTNGECEIQFAGVDGAVRLVTAPFVGRLETDGGMNNVFARYVPKEKF